jgi:predicted nucleotidyltransferase
MMSLNSNEIKFIAIGNNDEKGKALERQVGNLLSYLGYKDIHYNIHKTGMELDVKAKTRLTGEPLIVECKAHSREISTQNLTDFLGKLTAERGKNPRIQGLFVSLSGFNGTAIGFYDQNSEEIKSYFKIKTGHEFFEDLQSAGVVCSFDLLENKIKSISALPLFDITLLLSVRGLFWKITTSHKSEDIMYFYFLDAKAEAPIKNDVDWLLERITKEKNEIQIDLKESYEIIGYLLDNENKTIDDISTEVREPVEDLKKTLGELEAQGLIIKDNGKISLKKEIDAFFDVFKKIKNVNETLKFMKSSYFDKMLDKLPDFAMSKFQLNKLDINEIEVTKRILAISPTSLDFIISGDSEKYTNSSQHSKILTKLSQDKLHEFIKRSFFMDLGKLLIQDCYLSNNEYHQLKDIKSSIYSFDFKLATSYEIYLSLSGEIPMMSMKAGGPIKKGQFVTADDMGLFGIANNFMILRQYHQAITRFEDIIENTKDEKIKRSSQNNLGCILLEQKEYGKAKISILEAMNAEDEEIKTKAKKNYNICTEILKIKDIIIEKLQSGIDKLRKKYNFSEIGIFGDIVKERNIEDAVVNILVDFREPLTIDQYKDLGNEIGVLLDGRNFEIFYKKWLTDNELNEIFTEINYFKENEDNI